MHNKDKIIFDKKLPYEYNIYLYILDEAPNYELIVVGCKKEIAKDEFRKLIPTIVQKEKRFVESLEAKKNGQIVKYSYAIIPE